MQNENMLEEVPQQQLLPNSIPPGHSLWEGDSWHWDTAGTGTHGTGTQGTGILLRGLPGAVKAGHSEQHSSETGYGDVGGQGAVG